METALSFSSNVEVYFKEGSFNGFEINPAVWTKILTVTAVEANANENVDLFPEAETICPNSCAIYIYAPTGFLRYFTIVGSEVAPDGTLKIDPIGVGTASLFGNLFTNRYWYVKLSFRLITDIPKEGVHNLRSCFYRYHRNHRNHSNYSNHRNHCNHSNYSDYSNHRNYCYHRNHSNYSYYCEHCKHRNYRRYRYYGQHRNHWICYKWYNNTKFVDLLFIQTLLAILKYPSLPQVALMYSLRLR
jgi:hypothetical protein